MARWWNPTASLDATRIGGSAYTSRHAQDVLETLKHTDYQHPLNTASIALATGVPGRAVRQIIFDFDARVALVGARASGLFVCRYADEAAALTNRLDAHWRTERDRVRRRRDFANSLPRVQGFLFENMADLLADDEDFIDE